jgi:predicted nucleic acid-binding protein
LTLDSGALIAYERNDRDISAHLKEALLRQLDLCVPSVVVAEVWRGGTRSARVARLLGACIIVPLDDALARMAGEAIARLRKAGTIDAIVMASAGRRGDRVLTSDPDDLHRLQTCFPNVRVVRI